MENAIVIHILRIFFRFLRQDVQGFVKDQHGRPLKNATVIFNQKIRSTPSAADGSFSVDLKAGSYDISIETDEYLLENQKRLVLRDPDEIKIVAQLPVAPEAEPTNTPPPITSSNSTPQVTQNTYVTQDPLSSHDEVTIASSEHHEDQQASSTSSEPSLFDEYITQIRSFFDDDDEATQDSQTTITSNSSTRVDQTMSQVSDDVEAPVERNVEVEEDATEDIFTRVSSWWSELTESSPQNNSNQAREEQSDRET